MIKAIIIDDEPLARMVVKEYLQSYENIEIVAECNDGFEGVKAILKHQPQLIFLDVQMPKINGFEMLELIDEPPAVIFTTAFDEYALKAFEAEAVDYLLKPFSKERFDKAIERLMDKADFKSSDKTQTLVQSQSASPAQHDRVVVKTNGNIRIIPISDIHYLEAADDYVKIHIKESSFLKNKTMAYFDKTLSDALFVRTHRSYMVNIEQVTRLEPYEKESWLAILKSGAKVPVSKTGYLKLKALLGL